MCKANYKSTKTQKTNPNHRLEIPISSIALAIDTLLHLGANNRKELEIKKRL
jgi:hypothetical protein